LLAQGALTLGVDADRAEQRQNEHRPKQDEPRQIAVHHDMAGRPNGHAPQEGMAGDAQHTLDDLGIFEGAFTADRGGIARAQPVTTNTRAIN